MALWILVAGATVLALIVGGVLLLVLLATGQRRFAPRVPGLSRLVGPGPDEGSPGPLDH